MSREQENRRMLKKLGVFALFMFGFGFAMVPFYQKFCEVTGINNLIRPAAAVENTQIDTSRWVTIEFDANTHDLAWEFAPVQRSMRVHPGQMIQVAYEVRNKSAVPVVGQAIPSYGPKVAAEHVRKLECFCFTQQKLAAGESRTMPVQLVIDTQLPAEVNTITLSYTFFEVKGVGGQENTKKAG